MTTTPRGDLLMQEIAATRVDLGDDRALLHHGATPHEPNIGRGCRAVDADTGEPLMIVARFPGDLDAYRRAVRSIPASSTLRSGGSRNKSTVFGFLGRMPMLKRDACRACAAAYEAPRAHGAVCDAAEQLAELYADTFPEQYAADVELVTAQVLPEWRMKGTTWTSGVINFDSPLPYHYDRNNFDAWSAMVVIRRGTTGGHLHVPAYDLTVECADGDVMMFNGRRLLHAVTPLTRLSSAGYRISSVYYPVAKMRHCLTRADEVARSQAMRTEREDGWEERWASLGHDAGGSPCSIEEDVVPPETVGDP